MANGINPTQAQALARIKYLSSGEYYDQIVTARKTIGALTKLGAIKLVDGGWDFRVPVKLRLNPTVKSRAAWDVVEVEESNEFDYLDYEYRIVNGSYGIAVGDQVGNAGDSRVVDLEKSKQKGLSDDIQFKMNTMFFVGDATIATNTHGFPQLISASGSVGGKSRSTYTALQSYVGTGGTFTLKSWDLALNTIANNCGKLPNLIITTHAIKAKLMDQARDGIRYQSPNVKLAELGFVDGANHMGIPIIDDNDCADGEVWFINTDFLVWQQIRNMCPRATSQAELPLQSVMYVKVEMYSNLLTLQPRANGWLPNVSTA